MSRTRKIWTLEETELLKEKYSNSATADLLVYFPGRTLSSLNGHAHSIGLKKTKEHILMMYEKHPLNGFNTRFKKGIPPANKGVKMSQNQRAICSKTFFKKGRKPANTKEVGTISKRKDNSGKVYSYIKIADSHWELLHRQKWIEVNGEIPEGHRIHFKDGNTLNYTIENLMCLTPQEAMDMNRITNLPSQLQEVIKIKNKLIKKIKNHGKEQN